MMNFADHLTELNGAEDCWVRFQQKNLHFLLKNLHFLINNLHFHFKSQVLAFRSSLAWCWQKQGKVAEAERVYREILVLQEGGGGQGEYAMWTRTRLEALERGEIQGYPEPRWTGED